MGGIGNDLAHGHLERSTFSNLSSFPPINLALARHRMSQPRLRIYDDNGEVSPSKYMRRIVTQRSSTYDVPQPNLVTNLLREGASLVIDQLDEIDEVIELCAQEIEFDVHEAVSVNAYVTKGTGSSFGAHWDSHDVIILQLQGQKHWRVFGRGRDAPTFKDFDHSHTCPSEPIWEGLLVAGDILYLPRGWWHDVTGIGELSYHLTFGFTRGTLLDYGSDLVRQQTAQAAFRHDLARFMDSDLLKQHNLAVSKLKAAAENFTLDQ